MVLPLMLIVSLLYIYNNIVIIVFYLLLTACKILNKHGKWFKISLDWQVIAFTFSSSRLSHVMLITTALVISLFYFYCIFDNLYLYFVLIFVNRVQPMWTKQHTLWIQWHMYWYGIILHMCLWLWALWSLPWLSKYFFLFLFLAFIYFIYLYIYY